MPDPTPTPAVLPDARALKPCPFCGNDPISEGNCGIGLDQHTAWNIFCLGGEQTSPSFRKGTEGCLVEPNVEEATEAEAIAAWNQRATLPASDAAASEAGFVLVKRDDLQTLADLRTHIHQHEPDRVKWEGEWHDGPLATAYITTIEAVADAAAAMLAAAPKVASEAAGLREALKQIGAVSIAGVGDVLNRDAKMHRQYALAYAEIKRIAAAALTHPALAKQKDP